MDDKKTQCASFELTTTCLMTDVLFKKLPDLGIFPLFFLMNARTQRDQTPRNIRPVPLKRKRLLFFTILLLIASVLQAQNKPRKVLLILVDGIPADVLEQVATPALDRIAKAGDYRRAYVGGGKGTYSESPTISAVGYNSMLTGTWANKHNVRDNAIAAPNYYYPTLFRLFQNQFPAGKTAIFSSWTDNRTKLLGEALPQTDQLRLDFRFDGYELDTVTFPHDKQRNFMHQIDEKVTGAAVETIRKEGPDLSWVYLEYTDDMGHMHGDSPTFHAAIEKMDAQIGRIWQGVQFRQQQFKEDWLILITTDHGRDEQTGRHHGGQTWRQRSTWIVSNYPLNNRYARSNEPAIVDLMPTAARFLKLRIPPEINREVDGVSLIGENSLSHLEVHYIQGKIDLQWQVLDPQGNVKIWVSATNHFQTGGTDQYTLLMEVPVKSGHASVDVKDLPAAFYKVVLEAPHNTVNQWLILEESK
jgi:hypothetical protein